MCKQSMFLHANPCLYTCNVLVFVYIPCYFKYDTYFYVQHMPLGLVWFGLQMQDPGTIGLAPNQKVSQRGIGCFVRPSLRDVEEIYFMCGSLTSPPRGQLGSPMTIGLMYTMKC